MSDPYKSLNDALYYAAQRAAELGAVDGYEYMTGVFSNPDGTFGFLEPQGGESTKNVKAQIRYPKGSKLMALMHNHPEHEHFREKDLTADMFSPDDIMTAKEQGIPSYITHGSDLSISMFDPAKHRSKNAKGVPFTHIPEVQPAGQKIGGDPQMLAQIQALRGK